MLVTGILIMSHDDKITPIAASRILTGIKTHEASIVDWGTLAQHADRQLRRETHKLTRLVAAADLTGVHAGAEEVTQARSRFAAVFGKIPAYPSLQALPAIDESCELVTLFSDVSYGAKFYHELHNLDENLKQPSFPGTDHGVKGQGLLVQNILTARAVGRHIGAIISELDNPWGKWHDHQRYGALGQSVDDLMELFERPVLPYAARSVAKVLKSEVTVMPDSVKQFDCVMGMLHDQERVIEVDFTSRARKGGAPSAS